MATPAVPESLHLDEDRREVQAELAELEAEPSDPMRQDECARAELAEPSDPMLAEEAGVPMKEELCTASARAQLDADGESKSLVPAGQGEASDPMEEDERARAELAEPSDLMQAEEPDREAGVPAKEELCTASARAQGDADGESKSPVPAGQGEALENESRAAASIADPGPTGPGESAPMVEDEPRAADPAGAEPGSFVHVLVADAESGHEPQVFRMRGDQPMQRLLRTYMDFRRLPTAEADNIRISALCQERLDPLATAGDIGLADGDCVTVHVPPAVAAAAAAAAPEEIKGASRRRAPAKGSAAGRSPRRGKMAAAAAPTQRRQARRLRPRGSPLQLQEPEGQCQAVEQPKKPPTSYFLWFAERRGAVAEALGTSRARAVARAASEQWRAMSAEDRRPFEARAAELRGEYDRAISDFTARGGVLRRAMRKDPLRNLEASQRLPKRPWGGAYGEFMRQHREEVRSSLPPDAQVYDVTRECGRRWKELPEGDRRQYQERYAAKCEEYQMLLAKHPAAPTGTRTAAVTQGAAKGWKVQAWLNCRKALQWRIFEPRKGGRGFRTFNNFRALRGNVEERVYKQLSQMVKPGLIRRLSQKARCTRRAHAMPEDGETPSKRRRPRSDADGTIARQATSEMIPLRGDGDTPDRVERPVLATQALRPFQAWPGDCVARLSRHPRCLASEGPKQPLLVHLRDTMTFGRSDACDVVLTSSRTPQMLSRNHATLRREDGTSSSAFSISDQGSTNGILVNGKSVKGSCELRHGDVITFGVQTAQPEFDYIFEARMEAMGSRC